MHILGTAGHVDHGKSSLVRALTGTDPDRWLEEQVRGMTLDLGFAHLRFADGVEAGIVDVPGHERFLHNMLAGAAGMELLLLVIAATEGPRPQTLEHLAIVQYLNVARTIVVLSKADLVDDEELAFTEELAREQLRGTLADGAPYVPVSTVTGRGLDRLRDTIHDALLALPPRAPHAPAYLPIDRVFSLPGHGTIVTGTLMQGRIAAGDELALTPLGRTVRARSIQVFGERRRDADGGSRVAVNVPGVEVGELARGGVLADPRLTPVARFGVRFRPLPGAPAQLGTRRRIAVRAYVGAGELLGTLVLAQPLQDAREVAAVLQLRAPTIAIPGAAYVLRRLSPKSLLGGGTIGHAEHASEAPAADDAPDAPDVAAVLAVIRAAALAGAPVATLAGAANVRADRGDEIVAELESAGRIVRLAKPPAYLDGELAEDAYNRVRALLASLERAKPWAAGATLLGLARPIGVRDALLLRVLTHFVDDGRLTYRSGYYATPDFVPHLTAEQLAFFDVVFAGRGDAVPAALGAIVAGMKASKIAGLSEAFDTLLAGGVLVKVLDDVYRGTQIARIREQLEAALRERRELTMAEFRDAIGTSRKYAVPLMEYFDATGVTVRSGDVRTLREPPRAKRG